jgi:hypothetical protein
VVLDSITLGGETSGRLETNAGTLDCSKDRWREKASRHGIDSMQVGKNVPQPVCLQYLPTREMRRHHQRWDKPEGKCVTSPFFSERWGRFTANSTLLEKSVSLELFPQQNHHVRRTRYDLLHSMTYRYR